MLRNGKGYANAVKASPINSSTLESELLAMGETPGHSAPGLYPSSLSLTSDDISIPDRQVPSLISSPKYGGMPTSVDASGPMTSAGMPATPDDETTASAPFDRDGFRVVTSRLRSTSVGSADSNRSRISGPRVFSVEFGEVAESDNERARTEVEPVMMAVEKRLTKDEKARISRREKALARKKKDREAKVKRASAERKTAQASRDSSQSKSNANEAGPSYFEKGKFREEDVRGTEAEQVYRDHEIARAMQDAELEAATGETVKLRHPKEAKGKSAEKDKSRTKGLKTGKGDKKTGRDGLELTQFIQSPSPRAVLEPPAQDVQPNRLPLKSPKRAINQIPQGGYLWSAIGKEKSKKPSKNSKRKSRQHRKTLDSRLDEASSTSSTGDSSPSSSDSSSSSESSSSSNSTGSTSSSSSDSSSSPSSSSTDTDSSSSSSDSPGRRKRKRRSHNRQKRSRKSRLMKFPEPSTYNGRENLADFEKFVFETKNYFGASKMTSYWQIRALGKYLTDKAGQHYMAFAAVDPDKYTIDTYLRELFNHCFPPHFRQKMREKFNRCVQGTRGTREYLRELRTLGNRLPDIGETQIRHRFWEGSTSYIRLEWARAGLDPETSSLSQLEIAAERFESAERLRKLEEGKNADSRNGNRKREVSEDRGRHDRRRRNRKEVHRRKRSRDFSRRQRDTEGSKRDDTPSKSEGKQKLSKNRAGKYQDRRKTRQNELTQDEMDELRAANKCFTCKNVGHMSKDCPQRNSAKRPGLSTVTFIELEKLADAERESRTLTLGSIEWGDLVSEDLTWMMAAPSYESSERMEIREFEDRIRRKLDALIPLPGDAYADPIEEPRWLIYHRRRSLTPEFIITDTLMGYDRYHIPVEFLRHDVDFTEDFVETRWLAFVNATINDDTVTRNIIRSFEETLNSPESGLLNESTLRYGSRQYWVRNEADPIGSKEFVIQDMFPEPGYRGIDDIYRIARPEMLREGFNIANFMHDEKWVRQRILNAVSGRTYPSDAWSAQNPSIEPESLERWMIQTISPTAYIVLDRMTEKTHFLRRTIAYDSRTDLAGWMSEQQQAIHGEEWDGAGYSSDDGEFWTAVEGEEDHDYDLSRCGWNISPTWDMPEGLVPRNDFDAPPEGEMSPRLVLVTNTDTEAPTSTDNPTDEGSGDEPPALAYVSDHSDIEEDIEDDAGQWADQEDLNNDHFEGQLTADSLMDLDHVGFWRSSPTVSEDANAESDSKLEGFGNLHLGGVSVNNEMRTSDRDSRGTSGQAPRSRGNHQHGATSVSNPSVQLKTGAKPERRSQKRKTLDRLERNSARTKDFTRLVPSAIVVEVRVNGQSARALIDSGSLADFMSTKLADQLGVTTEHLEKPMAVQLAVTGSRTVVNSSTTVEFELQGVREQRRFDIINLESYDIILGTPFLFQHKVGMAFNPSKVAIGSNKSLPLEGEQIAAIPSRSADILEGELEKIRRSLKEEARDLCKGVGETSLPPLRAVNHEIPLIDPTKVYSWRPSKCPEAMRPLWNDKRDQYLKSGRWRFRTGNNASPMLILWKPKPGPDGKRKIRTVVDKREQNANTKKMASPLPDMEAMLRSASKHKYRSLMDGKDAYEQIRVLPEHVSRTLFNTPDGTMESLVLQQGDCNGGATYQSLMNHIFASYIGVFMDVYLDDILVYSNTIEDHIKHIRKIFDVLRREKLFLSPDKMDFFARELRILGHVVTDNGIAMDPHKVDSILNWKTPTSKELLSGFLGSVGYLANGIANVRIPMAVLTPLTGSERSFRWEATEQRAFEQIKALVHEYRNKYRVSIDYSKTAPWINLTCDASLTGAGGHLSQGDDLESAKNIAFWSGKFNTAQQNYPTHERELLAIIESLKRFKHLLLGAKFRIFSDHRSLENLSRQKNLSPRQARWLEFLCEFDYEIHYLPGSQNQLSDALSRMYSEEPEGVRRAQSEFVAEDEEPSTTTRVNVVSIYQPTEPLYTGPMALPELDLYTAVSTDQITLRRSSRIRKSTKPDDHDYDRLYLTKQPSKTKQPVKVTVEEVPDEEGTPLPHLPSAQETPLPDTAPMVTSPTPDNVIISQDSMRDESGNRDETITPENRDDGATGCKPQGESPCTEASHSAVPSENPNAPEPLAAIASSGEGIDIYGAITGRYSQDPLFKDIIADPARYRNFELRDGLLFLKDGGKSLLCIPDVKQGNRRVREILITYAHSLLAHLGSRKTVHYLRDHVWWKGLVSDVEAYCESCNVCSMTKSRTTKPFGMLKTLEVPSRPWQVVSIDFVGPLPLSKNRHGTFDMIAVIIDHLTSMVHIAPCAQTYKAKEIAELVFDVIYRHHGLPEIIVSDRDSYFTSGFYKELHQLIGVELRLSTAYHPQTDGATERANRTMTQMLRQCVSPNQKDWALKLPGIEFAMNCARSDTTGFSPFFLNYGRIPDPMVWDKSSDYPGVRVFAQRIKDAIMSAHDSIIAARVKQTKEANKHRRPAPFTKGDLVYLSTENLSLPKKRARKLVPKFIGPYRILEEISKGASYKLELPRELKQRGVHPIFHASLLRVHVPNDDRRFPGRNIRQLSAFEESPSEWDVEKIVTHYGKGDDVLFKLRWKSGDETWTDLRTASRLEQLQQYCDLLGVPSSAELPNKIDESPQDVEIHLSTAEIGASLAIKGRDGPVDWATDIPVYHNTSSLSTQPIMQGQQSPSFIETKRGRYSTALLDQYKEYEYKDLCNKIWYRTGHHDRILELGPPPQDFSWWASDPESHSITPYFTAVALNVPDHVITKFLKSTQDLEDAQAKVKSYSGGRQPAYRTTRGGNPRHTPRHNPIAKPSFHDLATSESETSSDPSSPTPTLDIAAMQTVAIQTFQNAIAPQLAAMMGQLSVPNQAIAHSGATPHMNSLQVTMQPQTAVVGAAIQDAPSPLEEILGPNPFGEDTNMGGQSQE